MYVRIDRFTKWLETASYANKTKVRVARLIKNSNSIICLRDLPQLIITNNVKNLNNDIMHALCAKFKISHQILLPY